MKDCFLVGAGAMLPGQPVESDRIQDYLGRLEGEESVKQSVLKMNGIVSRHYAQDRRQVATESVVSMAAEAIRRCPGVDTFRPTFLGAGSTHTPYSGPGLATLVHAELVEPTADKLSPLAGPLEISSHSGICSSGAAALLGAARAVQCGDHRSAIAVGGEHASEVLKSSVIKPIDDREEHCGDLKRSRWFMSVFLRFMLSDGAGAVLLADQPSEAQVSLKIDWVHSRSFAHDTELCMKLETSTGLLSQDVTILSRYLLPRTETFLQDAFRSHNESIDNYDVVLPHLSSFFFRRRMEKIMRSLSGTAQRLVPYWTNLATAGNTGAASIFVMLDEFLRTQPLKAGQRLLLFVPESGQFNFVLMSLTVVVA